MVLRRWSRLAIFQFPFLVRPRPVRDVAETGLEDVPQRTPAASRRLWRWPSAHAHHVRARSGAIRSILPKIELHCTWRSGRRREHQSIPHSGQRGPQAKGQTRQDDGPTSYHTYIIAEKSARSLVYSKDVAMPVREISVLAT